MQIQLHDGNHFHCVPIKSSLQALFRDENINSHMQVFERNVTSIGRTVLNDFGDGTLSKSDPFLSLIQML